jgi:HAD superfamily hydrolase (TIGR01509 family)
MSKGSATPAAVLWDMDGTLVDTEPYWIACEYELVAEHGGTWSEEHAHAIVGMDLRDAAAYIRDHGPVDMAVDDIVNRLLDGVTLKVRESVPWRPGARELLADLRARGVRCALVTMSWRRFADAVVDALPVDSFDVIVAGDEVANGKPDPEPYATAAARLGVDVRDCVAIEDSPTGISSAVAAGCLVVAVPNVVEVAADPAYTITPTLAGLDADALTALVQQSDSRSAAALRTSSVAPETEDRSDSRSAAPVRTSRTALKRGRWIAIAVAVVALLAAAVVIAVTRDESAAPPPPDIPIDGWSPYWVLDVAEPNIAEHGTMLREVSPFWFQATGPTTIVADPNVPSDGAAQLIATARAQGAAIVPSITDGMPSGQMAAILADPAQRSAHVGALVDFVEQGGYDGVDLDYESFAFKDGRGSWATTRPNWVDFVTELAARLHADGKTLAVTVPWIGASGGEDDPGYWVYDYAAIADVADHVRIMAYDEHNASSDPGAVASLPFVRRAIAAAKRAVDDDSKLVLGVMLGGYNWPISTEGTCPTNVDTGVTRVDQATVDDLLAKRNATPVRNEAAGESWFTYTATFTDGTASCTQDREVHYVDAEGAGQRVDLARTEGLGGASLWALGYDSPATWAAIGPLSRPDNGAGTVSSNPST